MRRLAQGQLETSGIRANASTGAARDHDPFRWAAACCQSAAIPIPAQRPHTEKTDDEEVVPLAHFVNVVRTRRGERKPVGEVEVEDQATESVAEQGQEVESGGRVSPKVLDRTVQSQTREQEGE